MQQKYQGLMRMDFSMKQDLEVLQNDIYQIGKNAVKPLKQPKHRKN
jgi:hypothetical protein